MTAAAYKLAKLFDHELKVGLKDLLIIKDTNNHYELFGVFKVAGSNSYCTVTELNSFNTYYFTCLKNAIAWCILKKHGSYNDALVLMRLDMKLSSLRLDNYNHKRIVKIASNEHRLICINKLHEGSFKIKQVTYEIGRYIEKSIKLQNIKFSIKSKPWQLINRDK